MGGLYASKTKRGQVWGACMHQRQRGVRYGGFYPNLKNKISKKNKIKNKTYDFDILFNFYGFRDESLRYRYGRLFYRVLCFDLYFLLCRLLALIYLREKHTHCITIHMTIFNNRIQT